MQRVSRWVCSVFGCGPGASDGGRPEEWLGPSNMRSQQMEHTGKTKAESMKTEAAKAADQKHARDWSRVWCDSAGVCGLYHVVQTGLRVPPLERNETIAVPLVAVVWQAVTDLSGKAI